MAAPCTSFAIDAPLVLRAVAHQHFAAILIKLRLYKQVDHAKAVAVNVEKAGGAAVLLNSTAAATAGAAAGKAAISCLSHFALPHAGLGSEPAKQKKSWKRASIAVRGRLASSSFAAEGDGAAAGGSGALQPLAE